jgi:hypothetical protein
MKGPSAKKTREFINMNRDQLWWVVGLLTGHCHPKGHLLKLRLANRPICERCLQKEESVTHILCHCEATANLRFCHMDHYFMEPSNYHVASTRKVLCFITSVGLTKG